MNAIITAKVYECLSYFHTLTTRPIFIKFWPALAGTLDYITYTTFHMEVIPRGATTVIYNNTGDSTGGK